MSTHCLTPFRKKGETIDLPCGRCPNCKKRYVSGWSWRLFQEGLVSSQSFFVTLTYDNDNIPITPKKYMTVVKKHVQDFLKRLRYYEKQRGNKKSIRYYAAAEYGTDTDRPHYHIILFNAASESVHKAWTFGYVHIGQVSSESCAYTLKYISKPNRIPMHKNDDRLAEFSLKSKGLGYNYITPDIIKWHHADVVNRGYIPLFDGKKIAMPRVFKEKIFDDFQRWQISCQIKKQLEDHEHSMTYEEIVAYDMEQELIARELFRKAETDNRRTKL